MSQPNWNEQEFDLTLSQRTEELYRIPNMEPKADGLIEAAVLPLRDMVIFPRMVSPIFIGREASLLALEEAHVKGQTLIGLTQRDPEVEDPGPDDFLPIGVEMAVGRLLEMPDGSHSALAQGRRRVEIVQLVRLKPYIKVRARVIHESPTADRQTQALMRSVLNQFDRCIQLDRSIPEEAHVFALNISEPGWLADMISTSLGLTYEAKLRLLMILDPKARLGQLNNLLAAEVDVLELEDEIHSRVQNEVDKSQREFYLREQMKQIQTELGEGDVFTRDAADLKKRIEVASLPEEARKVALKEVERLNQMPPMAPEMGIIRSYIDWILELPWNNPTPDNLDVKNAAKILERDHYGLKKAKERILEYIAVRSLKPKKERQPILCFVGPPGVGKTSLGRSIADALGRKFARVSLGGVRDEAEIRGHRRTYIGALPGRIIQTMKRAGTSNPLFMLDEIDKLYSDFRGDPASAMLEVLDPEQNNSFRDNYLGVPFDLSRVMFIATANMLDTIPGPLRDRMEVITLSGYTEEEKLQIAKRYLVDRQLRANGLKPEQVEIGDDALRVIIHDYTREAGVRNLEREIGSVFRSVAMRIAEGTSGPIRIDPDEVARILGPRRFESELAMRTSVPGVATGLAWTPVGGDILFIEATRVPGTGKLVLTGHLGDVMKESAQIALSLAKSRLRELGVAENFFEKNDVHIHVPAGAIPKDGPSAGVAMYTALTSLLTQKTVRSDTAMTGEISLRGLVLPVGGIKEKVVAAVRAGITTALLPSRNRKDLEDIPEEARRKIRFVWVDRVEDAVQAAIGDDVTKGRAAPELASVD